MLSLLSRFQKYINDQQLISGDEKLIIAVSGGVDSVVLCHLFSQLKKAFEIAHCNFGLRGEESETDEIYVRELAESYSVPVHVKKFQTDEYAKQHGISIQMAARDLRYDWFKKLTGQNTSALLATAHHANDQIETVFYNLAKGTGISGLRGIKAKSQHIIRPLLFATKQEILEFANMNHLYWREDASNESDKYHRNHMRHHVIPELSKINPSLEKTLQRNIDRFQSLENLLFAKVQDVIENYGKMDSDVFSLKMDWFDLSKGGLVVLEELIKPYGFNNDQCQNIVDSLSNGTGNQFFSGTHKLSIDRGCILLQEVSNNEEISVVIQEGNESIVIDNQKLTLKRVDQKVEFENNANCAYLDFDKVHFPIFVRNWQKGDRFIPLGMKQEKKVSDFMIDEKIPLNLKKRLLLFESNNEIFWIAGHRISDRHKITPKTKKSLIIKLEENV
ncbi:MAG: tRNA lysidine(34) synthetase TilS [Reichenbachiella sp.]